MCLTAEGGKVDWFFINFASKEYGWEFAANEDDTDYGKTTNFTIKFAAGETSKELVFLVKADDDFEADEQFTVDLTKTATGAVDEVNGSAIGTILNDDLPPVDPLPV